MVLENVRVKHKSFGDGVVTEQIGKYITVDFGTVKKKFVYPDSFESFLSFADGSLSDEVLTDIAAAKAAKQVIIDRKNEENLRAMTKGIVIPGKEATLGGDSDDEENRAKETEEF